MKKKEACKAAARAIKKSDDLMSGVCYFRGGLVVVHGGRSVRHIQGGVWLGDFGQGWGVERNARAIGEAMRAQHIETRDVSLWVGVHEYLF